MSAYYPVVLTGASLIVCFWAEVFHLREIRWDRPRFLSKVMDMVAMEEKRVLLQTSSWENLTSEKAFNKFETHFLRKRNLAA